MTTCTDTIKNAFWKAGIVPVGNNMTGNQPVVGLQRLQEMYNRWIGDRLFGELTPKLLTDATSYEAKEWELVTTDGGTVTFPTTVRDDDDGNDRAPKDGAMVVVATSGEDPSIKVYDAFRAEWLETQALALTDYAPLSHRFQNQIESYLAVMLADIYGYPISKTLAAQFGSAKLSLATIRKRESQQEFY